MINLTGEKKPTASSFPESWTVKSEKQKTLERNGCVFRGQERLDNHEIDLGKKCYCGRGSQKGERND